MEKCTLRMLYRSIQEIFSGVTDFWVNHFYILDRAKRECEKVICFIHRVSLDLSCTYMRELPKLDSERENQNLFRLLPPPPVTFQAPIKLSRRAGGRHQHTQSPRDGLCLIEREHYTTGLSLPWNGRRIPQPPLFT